MEKSEQANRIDQAIVQRVLDVLLLQPSALVTDIDGTISEIAATPATAFVLPQAIQALQRLSKVLAMVAVVTGRSAADGQRLMGLNDLLVVGNHGMETRIGDRHFVQPPALSGATRLKDALDAILAEATESGLIVGLVIENKAYSGSVHYRLAPNPDELRDRLLALIGPIAKRFDLLVTEGQRVVELRLPLHVHKGTAILDLAAERGLRSIVFTGDDITDLDAFVELRGWAAKAEGNALSIAVVSPTSNPIVAAEADIVVSGVEECAALFCALADELERRSS
jgi:trehalose 6-phosphate phosphatase